jgi:tRNA nucleotidyltransferase (CCA-adding enzyme)
MLAKGVQWMEVITTHLNADFDAFASMVAAKKLYPDALVAFSGSQGKNVRDFFMESTLYILSIDKAKDIDLTKVRRLVLVDTRQRSRIGRFAQIADSSDVELHIFDHHPASEDDVKGDHVVIEEVGATVTILIRQLRSRGIEINAEEATVLALGIYEDTGSFIFPSTTGDDLEAAAWLLGKGANLNIIANMMTSDLSADQIEVLHQLIQESELVTVGGVDIVVTTAGAENYIGDLAVLVHKYKDMESLDAIFALVRMEDRIHLIGRSSVEEVNAGEIVAEFGGGGHPTAASATIRDMSSYQARDKLIRLLRDKVHPKQKAGEIMSRPVITIDPQKTIDEAAEFLSRYQVSSLPVLRDEAVIGILHRNAVEKAAHHGLNSEPVMDYMNPGAACVAPEDSIETVLRMTVEGRHRIVPVVDGGHVVGVISRSDLLEHMKLPRTSDTAGPHEFPVGRMRSRSVRKLMEERLPQRVLAILRRAGEVAERRCEDVYLVGGAVRDLLLRDHNLDIDLVVEGEGIPFSRELAAEFSGCRVRGHEKFGTAVLLFPDGFKIDMATARHEYYSSPGALPTVETSSIKRDLYRRDFTINTLAVNVTPLKFGQVIDFFGGSRDIKERVIRVLHNLAFVEDPTRILRAIRFSSRFGFTIAKHTVTLMKGALRMKIFDKVEGKRILNEFIHILHERNPVSSLTAMAGLGILQAVHPSLTFNVKNKEMFESAAGVLSWWKYLFVKEKIDAWLVYFVALTDFLSNDDFQKVMDRLSFPPSKQQKMFHERTELRKCMALFAGGLIKRPSEIADALGRFSIESLLFAMAKTTREETRMAISEYVSTLRHVRPLMTGKDVIAMGYEPGPTFGLIFKKLRDAKLNGILKTEDDERTMIKDFFPLENHNMPVRP